MKAIERLAYWLAMRLPGWLDEPFWWLWFKLYQRTGMRGAQGVVEVCAGCWERADRCSCRPGLTD